jgi:hypothetical protein
MTSRHCIGYMQYIILLPALRSLVKNSHMHMGGDDIVVRLASMAP